VEADQVAGRIDHAGPGGRGQVVADAEPGPPLLGGEASHRVTTAAGPGGRQLRDRSGVTELTASAPIRMEPECLLWRLLGTCDGWAVVEMSASGSEAAARARAANPPRLVAVPGGGNGRPQTHPARSVVFLGLTDDASGRVAAALLAHRSKGRVRAISVSPATVDLGPVVTAALGEVGADLAAVVTRRPSPAVLAGAELVVIMGYAVEDPAGGRPSEDWCIDDPRGKDPDAVRCIRDALDRRVQRLLVRMGVAVPTRRR
jgi:hypothetical protein